ncbi:MAG TPA: hypothetical protein EYN38_10810 [Flavobacteriales bacterium]|nr:hypothetical protein [Flavobacteriales bacterium]
MVEETLDEIGMASGAVSGPAGSVLHKRDTKKKKKLKTSKPRKTEVNEVSEEELDEGFFDFVTREESSQAVYNQAELLKNMWMLPKEDFAKKSVKDRELLKTLLGWKLPVSLEAIAAAPGRLHVDVLDASVDWETIRNHMVRIQDQILDTGEPVTLPTKMTSYKRDTKKKRS